MLYLSLLLFNLDVMAAEIVPIVVAPTGKLYANLISRLIVYSLLISLFYSQAPVTMACGVLSTLRSVPHLRLWNYFHQPKTPSHGLSWM